MPGTATRITTTAGRSAPIAGAWTGSAFALLYLDDTTFAGDTTGYGSSPVWPLARRAEVTCVSGSIACKVRRCSSEDCQRPA
jgi:hypothetical protein